MKITFVSTSADPSIPEPVPAVKKIPEWYKSIPRYTGKEKKPQADNSIDFTIKTCMPVLDAMTAGYLILSAADLYISKGEEGTFYQWANHDLITFHGPNQVVGYPKSDSKLNGEKAPKFNNPWLIQTPKNYSCLFISPLHHDLPFTTLAGVVDTDTYFNPVNFPFLPDPDFEGLIPRGTPIAQVIPFKRESWEMSCTNLQESSQFENLFRKVRGTLLSEYFDRYKRYFWAKKEYK